MARQPNSLIAGRNTAPLTEHEISRATNTLVGIDNTVSFVFEVGQNTRFRVTSPNGEEIGEIVIGEDIYPGRNAIDPNSSLSMKAAICHELSHYNRWIDRTELDDTNHMNLDECLTSLDAILRFYGHLNDSDIQQLVRDAIQRVQRHLSELAGN